MKKIELFQCSKCTNFYDEMSISFTEGAVAKIGSEDCRDLLRAIGVRTPDDLSILLFSDNAEDIKENLVPGVDGLVYIVTGFLENHGISVSVPGEKFHKDIFTVEINIHPMNAVVDIDDLRKQLRRNKNKHYEA